MDRNNTESKSKTACCNFLCVAAIFLFILFV